MSQPLSARLPDATAERLRQYAGRKQRSVNETLGMAVEEWLRQNEFAFIEFRDTPDGRLPYMKSSRLPVYRVVMTARQYGMDVDRIKAHWPDRPREWIQAALNYFEAYPEEIEAQIAAYGSLSFEELKRRMPQAERITVPAQE
jgi:uncharacterized protein (DUF433 family)